MPGLWPVFAARDERFRAACRAKWGAEPGHVRTVATYAEQKDLYDRWRAGTFRAPSVADPDAAGYLAPYTLGEWRQHGSWHMEQQDDPGHHGYAIDYSWIPGVPIAEQHALALEHGIGFPLPDEDWHGQPFDWTGVYPDAHDPLNPEDEDVSLTIHYPTMRGEDHNTWDFQYLPADGSKLGGRTAAVAVTLRQAPNTGADVDVQVFFDGHPSTVRLPGDGRTMAVSVPAAGLCSVVGSGLCVQAREFWS